MAAARLWLWRFVFPGMLVLAHLLGAEASKCKYKVFVKTGCQNYAGTDADVSIKLSNSVAQIASFKEVHNAGVDDFVQCRTDSFDLVGPCVLNPCKLELTHNNEGWGSEWFVDWVMVVAYTSPTPSVTTFHINNWVKKPNFSATSNLCTPHSKSTPFKTCSWLGN